MLYLDTSALAKLYVTEQESAVLQSLVTEHQADLGTSVVTYAEMLSLLARCRRENRLTLSEHRLQRRAFQANWKSLHVVELTTEVLLPAERLVELYNLRGYDAVQLCSAFWIGRPLFACLDERLRLAARKEGLSVAP